MTNNETTRVLIFWSRISGYMAACWKRLASLQNIDLTIVAWNVDTAKDNTAFDRSIVDGLDIHLFPAHVVPMEELTRLVVATSPDVVVVPGWMHPNHRKLAIQLKRRFECRVVMGMDTPWTGTAKQRLSQLVRRAQLRHVDHVITAGERASEYARRLGFSSEKITEGIYAWDEQLFGNVANSGPADHHEDDIAHGTSNGFLFIGRYVREKGISHLLDAYQRYRESVTAPWPLTCCGTGPLADQLRLTEGVQDLGFQAPAALPKIMSQSEAFVFPSIYEPWGVALAEAMGAGLPSISTEACGAARDLIIQGENGRIIPAADADSLLEAMCWLHDHPDKHSLGQQATRQAARYTTIKWAERWQQVFERLLNANPPSQ